MIVPSRFNGYNKDGTRLLFMGGGGGGGTTQTTSTVQNTNIPEYAKGYVENMLGATQKQLFNTSQVQTGTDDQGNAIMGTQIDSFKPYQAYGGKYDAQGNQISYDPGAAIAGFSPAQLAAQKGIAGLTTPGDYDNASYATVKAYERTNKLADDYKASTYGNQFTAPGAYTAGTFGGQQVSAPNLSQYSMGNVNDMTGATAGITQLGAAPTISQADINQMSAAQLGAAPTATAAQGQAAVLGEVPTYEGKQLNYTPTDIGYDRAAAERVNALPLEKLQMQAAGNVGTGSFTQPGAASQYMSPYMQSVVDTQQREAQRQADIAKTQRSSQAVRAGAFGGSRQAIENAEAARNLATQKGDIQSQGLQSAFQQAQQQYNTEQQTALQAALANQQVQQQTGVQNLSALLQTQGLGAQTGLTAQTANQQTALQAMLANQGAGIDTSKFNQTQQYNTAMQNAQLAQQQQLANQSLQGQYGLTQGQMNQQMNMANLSNSQQTALANQAMQGQYGMQQGQMSQAANAANQAAQNQALYANQGIMGQYGMQQGQMNQAVNLANQSSQNQAAAQNQQMAYNTAQQNLAAQLGIQQLGSGQTMQSQLANQQNQLAAQQAGEQSKQFGATQGLNAAQLSAQYGLAGQQLSEQAKQFGGQFGMQANAQALGAANQYANIAGQKTQSQMGILNAQNTMGAQQQALEQAKINQSMLDYANAQQYPLMQLGTMSNMLRGLPMQASTTNQYAASPSPMSQVIGAGGAAASMYNATKPGGAAGGLPSEFKYAKGGGIKSYDMGGEVESQLENMDEKGLQAQARESSSPSIRKMAQRLLRERQMGNQAQGADAASVQYQAAGVPSYKPGGIVAFVAGGGANEEGGEAEAKATDMSGKTMEERLAMPPPSAPSGIMAAAPITQVPASAAAPSPDVVQEAMRQRNLASAQAARPTADVLKDIQAEREALGVGENKGREEFRSQQMAERANMKDEQERQRNMRLAEFFASWGSTPGPVLVAGMNALKQSIPNIIADEKDAKKARKEADKIIYDIDEATRLEKLGMIDKATALKEKAASHAEDYNKYLLTFQSQRESDKRAKEVAETQAAASIKHAEIMAASHGKSNAAADKRADELTRNNFQTNALKAKQAADRLETDIAKEAKDNTEYKINKTRVSTTKIDKKEREKAQEIVNQYETGWNSRRQSAKDDLALAQEQLKDINERLGYGKKPDSSATPPPAAASATAAPSITIAGQTFTKPDNMTAAQWDAYKKSQGVK